MQPQVKKAAPNAKAPMPNKKRNLAMPTVGHSQMLRNSHPESIFCVERIYLPSLYRLMNSASISDQLMLLVDKMEPIADSNYALVMHEWRKGRTAPFGRYFSGGALISQARDQRQLLMHDQYVEFDLRASNPTLLYNVMKTLGHELPTLRQYVSNPAQCERALLEELPEALRMSPMSDGKPFSVKQFVNTSMNGSNKLWSCIEPHLHPCSAFRALRTEFQFALQVIDERFAHVPANRDSYNQKASRLTNVLLTVECDILLTVLNRLVEEELVKTTGTAYHVGLAYDGLLIEQRDDVSLHTIRRRVQAIVDVAIASYGYEFLCMRQKPQEQLQQVPGVPELVPQMSYFTGLDQYREDKILIRSPTGSGKTTASIEYAVRNYRRVLIIVHRQMLALDMKRRYPNFGCYLNFEDDNKVLDADYQIICLNSLDKLKDASKYQCVVCDEISSVMWQLVEMRVSNLSIELFGLYATSPGIKFIGLDALLCEQDADFWVQEMAERGLDVNSVRFIMPSAIAVPEKICRIYDDVRTLKLDIVKNIREGKRVCIAYSTSIDKMNGLLNSLGVEFINVNRYTRHEHEIANWPRYQVIAFSPTMDAGVDVTFVNADGDRFQHFDIVYGIFNAANTTPKQAVQMLGRVRDCTEFRVCITGHLTDRVFSTRSSFDDYVKSRYEYITQYNLDASLNADFSANLSRNIRYRLTFNAVCHRSESQKYARYFKRFLMTNQWALGAPVVEEDDDDDENVIDIAHVEEEGMRAEIQCIASARVVDASEYDRRNMTIQTHREYTAWAVNRAFGLDLLRAPPPPGIFEGGSSREIELYRAQVQEQQYMQLYPYDASGTCIGFDYVSEYRDTRDFYFRALQLITPEREDDVFTFVLHRPSFKEVTHQCRTTLDLLGFTELDRVLDRVQYDAARSHPYLELVYRGKGPAIFLREAAGLTIEHVDEGYVLGSAYISDDPSTVGAYYISNSPFLYTGVTNQTAIGTRFSCKFCGRMLSRRALSRHSCRSLPSGFEYSVSGTGEPCVVCGICRTEVKKNRKRHRDRCLRHLE